jgi:hypothetical protein
MLVMFWTLVLGLLLIPMWRAPFTWEPIHDTHWVRRTVPAPLSVWITVATSFAVLSGLFVLALRSALRRAEPFPEHRWMP